MNGGLEPEELTRLLRAAVEPIRTSPDAYQRIRAGVDHRPWWRIPLMAAGGLVMAALIGLAVVAIRPQSSNQVVDPVPPPLISSAVSEPRASVPSTGGGRGSGAGSGQPGASSPRPTTPSPPATATTAPATTAPSTSTTTSPPGPGGAGALDRPPPVRVPAGPKDVDGDGVADQVRFVGTTVQVVLSREGTTADVDLPGLPAPAQHAVVDVDGDGYSEILIRTSSKDGVDDFGMLRYAARGVVAQVVLDTGVRLAAGTHDNVGFGFRCGEGRLEVINGTSADGSSFQLVTTPLELTVDRLSPGLPVQTQLVVTPTNNPFLAACGTFTVS